jgi:hypothetical protein
MAIQVTQRADGWFELDLPGWPGHKISAFCINIDGRPRVIGLKVEPIDGDGPVGDWVVTSERLRKIPIKDVAYSCIGLDFDEVMAAMDNLRAIAEPDVTGDPRRKATVEEVAAIYEYAQQIDVPPRKEIMSRLHISSRTMDRYIKEGRDMGLIPPYDSNAPKPKLNKERKKSSPKTDQK